ncbi:MAG: hypothetical protein JNM76_18300 [Betaproteobacteria bacterium]|nr:hypothetical protein [Betaproteobacteria bacterium]
MKLQILAALLTVSLASPATARQDAVRFEVVVTQAGKLVAAPSMIVEFDKTGSVELSEVMRVEAKAARPGWDGLSETSVRVFVFESGALRPVKDMSMQADLSRTPSFEYTVPGTTTRFVIKPRLTAMLSKGAG